MEDHEGQVKSPRLWSSPGHEPSFSWLWRPYSLMSCGMGTLPCYQPYPGRPLYPLPFLLLSLLLPLQCLFHLLMFISLHPPSNFFPNISLIFLKLPSFNAFSSSYNCIDCMTFQKSRSPPFWGTLNFPPCWYQEWQTYFGQRISRELIFVQAVWAFKNHWWFKTFLPHFHETGNAPEGNTSSA